MVNRLQRVFGRRDVKMFLLLWIPVAWTWFLYAQDAGASGEDYVRFLALFLARILGGGFVLLGVASGVERHHRLRHRGSGKTVRGGILCLGGSLLAVFILIAFGLFAFSLVGIRLLGLTRWGTALEVVFSVSYIPFSALLRYPRWPVEDVSPWVTWALAGWIIGYLIGKKRGRFISSVAIAALLTLALTLIFHFASWLPGGADLGNADEDYAKALWRDTPLLLAFCFLFGSILRELVSRPSRPRIEGALRGGPVAAFLLLSLGYRGLFIRQLDPWPPPARTIVGADPETGLLWMYCGKLDESQKLFGTPLRSGTLKAPEPEVQELYRITGIFHGEESPRYDPVSGSMLVLELQEGKDTEWSWRTPRGTEKMEGEEGRPEVLWRRVHSPQPGWYVGLPSRMSAFNALAVRSPEGKPVGLRLPLYCPATGEKGAIVARPDLTEPIVEARTWPMSAAYEFHRKPEPVPVEATDETGSDDLINFCGDGFLFEERSDMLEKQVFAIVYWNWDIVDSRHVFVSPEVSFSLDPSDYRSIPSPSGERGCVWDPTKGQLRVLERGKTVSSTISDATTSLAPDWSPDGRYLVYASLRWRAAQAVVKTAYPTERVILDWITRHHWQITTWSVRSDWLAVITDFGSDDCEVFVFEPPDFEDAVLRFSPGPIPQPEPLHDGSLVYIDQGKVFQWRPGWGEEVCLYDPKRKTVKTSAK